jgi:hypothetical protein
MLPYMAKEKVIKLNFGGGEFLLDYPHWAKFNNREAGL